MNLPFSALLLGFISLSYIKSSQAQDYQIQMDQNHWNFLQGSNAGDATMPCNIKEKQQAEYTPCKIKVHGGISRYYPKHSFRITTDKGFPAISYSRKILLKSDWKDGTYLREILSYQMFRDFSDLPFPQMRPVSMTVNGRSYGIMLEQEDINDDFLQKRSLEELAVFKSDAPDDIFEDSAGALLPLPQELYLKAYNPVGKSDLRVKLLSDFITNLWNVFNNSESILNSGFIQNQRIIDYVAIMGVIQNLDYTQKNFYLALSDNGPAFVIPYDLDLSWGCYWDGEEEKIMCDELLWNLTYKAGHLSREKVSVYPNPRNVNLLYQLVWDDVTSARQVETKICSIIKSEKWLTQIPITIKALAEKIKLMPVDDALGRLQGKSYQDGVAKILRFHAERTKYLKNKLCKSKEWSLVEAQTESSPPIKIGI